MAKIKDEFFDELIAQDKFYEIFTQGEPDYEEWSDKVDEINDRTTEGPVPTRKDTLAAGFHQPE